jgi:hypothetical protein
MSQGSRFDNLLKAAQQPATPPQPEGVIPDVQTSGHSDIQTSKAKSSSRDYKRTTVYLTQDLHRKLKQASLDHSMEMSDIAEASIAQWIAEHPSNQG